MAPLASDSAKRRYGILSESMKKQVRLGKGPCQVKVASKPTQGDGWDESSLALSSTNSCTYADIMRWGSKARRGFCMIRTVVSHDSTNCVRERQGLHPSHNSSTEKERERGRGRERERALEPHSRAAHPVRDAVKIQTQHR